MAWLIKFLLIAAKTNGTVAKGKKETTPATTTAAAAAPPPPPAAAAAPAAAASAAAPPAVSATTAAAAATAWTPAEQKLLEQALKTYPATVGDRWDQIATCIPNRSKKDCMRRYKVWIFAILCF